MGIAENAALGWGYRPVVYTDRKGRRSEGFQKNGVIIKIGGSTTYSYSSYSTFLYFERVN